MRPIQTLTQSVLIGTSLLGLSAGLTVAQTKLPAGAEDMPAGYTLSKTPIPGKHCYHHGGPVYFYCYSRTIKASEIKSHSTMMKKKGDSMMKKGDSMMKKGDSMMKKEDSMMMHK